MALAALAATSAAFWRGDERAVASAAGACARVGAAGTGGSTVWVSRYNGPADSSDAAYAIAVSPDGSKVFAAGSAVAATVDYATVAYDASTGAEQWDRLYGGKANGTDWARAIAVGPDGSTVFVIGESMGKGTGRDFGTVAYDASTGTQLWAAHYNGQGTGFDSGAAIAVSADGSKVFVTGKSQGAASGYDYATVAYDAATGAQLWVERYDGPASDDDMASAIGLSRDGSTVFVTGSSAGSASGLDYATIAYEASTGTQLWVARYGGPANSDDGATALALSRDGRDVLVTGGSVGSGYETDYATVAYDASTGGELWVARYVTAVSDVPSAIGASAAGVSTRGTVFVTGESGTQPHDAVYATVAYDGATGRQLWTRTYSSGCNPSGVANALGVSSDGSEVFVTGSSPNWYAYATVAYDALSGAQLWDQHYVGPGTQRADNVANALALSPDRSKVFVTGYSDGGASLEDFATVAYTAR